MVVRLRQQLGEVIMDIGGFPPKKTGGPEAA
jgi:hypothetical protein